jgi:hypothetical protein
MFCRPTSAEEQLLWLDAVLGHLSGNGEESSQLCRLLAAAAGGLLGVLCRGLAGAAAAIQLALGCCSGMQASMPGIMMYTGISRKVDTSVAELPCVPTVIHSWISRVAFCSVPCRPRPRLCGPCQGTGALALVMRLWGPLPFMRPPDKRVVTGAVAS